ncbi:hypothetical protein COOONC_09037 [Cooperia oncophora]
MSLLRAAGTSLQRKNRVGPLAIPTSSLSDSSVTTVRKFIGDPFDRYLASLGLVKKTMPNDKGSSLYRAVCESLSMDQREHAALQQFIEEQLLFQYHIQRIEDGLPRVNRIEDALTTIAHLLSVDLHVYREIGERPVIYKGSTGKEPAEKVMLCETCRGHFDLVITREDHTNLALAQTILYEALYVGVFGFSRSVIKESIEKVRKDMDTIGADVQTPSEYMQEQSNGDCSFSDGSSVPFAPAWRPPIPYSSVKSLDPSVYRNLAYDLYLKNKRRPSDCGVFQTGTPCIVIEGESFYRACVLSVPDKNSRLVLVNGIERKVSVSKLLPLPCCISPDRSLPYSSPSTNTEKSSLQYFQLSSNNAETPPQFPISNGWPAIGPYWVQYNRTQSLRFQNSQFFQRYELQYMYPAVPNGFVTPTMNSNGNFPYYYAPNLSSGECVSVVCVECPAYSNREYVASYLYEHGGSSVSPHSAVDSNPPRKEFNS